MRTITLTDHPSNIAVFEATGMYEAVHKADKAFRQDGIQGAIWASKPVPLIREQEAEYGPSAYRLAGNASQPSSVYGPSLRLDQTRYENLRDLSKIFAWAALEVRRSRSGLGIESAHIDGKDYRMEDPEKLFFGFEMRMICAREKFGTLVKQEKTQEWWQVNAGHSLFLCGKNFVNKALVHAFPEFRLNKDQFPRVTDVYDFRHGG